MIAIHWPPNAILWLRQLGGKLGIPTDRDGPYWLLHGISAVIVTSMTLSFAFLHPFPFREVIVGNHQKASSTAFKIAVLLEPFSG